MQLETYVMLERYATVQYIELGHAKTESRKESRAEPTGFKDGRDCFSSVWSLHILPVKQ